MKLLPAINTAFLGGILICVILIASRPTPVMTARDYLTMDKNKRDLLIPVVAVKGIVGIAGEVSIRGPVPIETSSSLPLDVIIKNDELKVAPSLECASFPVKIDGDPKHPIETKVINLKGFNRFWFRSFPCPNSPIMQEAATYENLPTRLI